MINKQLLSFLEKYLGVSKRSSNENYSFYSPFRNHYKPKLDIKLTANSSGEDKYPWHCWITNTSGKSIRSLVKKIGYGHDVLSDLNSILHIKYGTNFDQNTSSIKKLRLPHSFIKLTETGVDKWERININNAKRWLRQRGLTDVDFWRYDIGYCIDGRHAGRVIVPSYDRNGDLKFWTGRTIFDDDKIKYTNPNWNKNFIGFENLINWDQPLYLTEGVFDAITLRKNSIPLFGKTIPRSLEREIIIRKPDVWLCLDMDAQTESNKIAKRLHNRGINVYVMKFDAKDMNDLGFIKIQKVKENTKIMDEAQILKDMILLS